jgi:hypothetical protein
MFINILDLAANINQKPGLHCGPLQRDHQRKFNLLRQEVGAVLSVLDQQHHAVEYLEELIQTHHLDAKTGQTPDLSRLRETIVARQCASIVRSRIRAFKEIDLQTQLLSEEVSSITITSSKTPSDIILAS